MKAPEPSFGVEGFAEADAVPLAEADIDGVAVKVADADTDGVIDGVASTMPSR